MRRRMYDRNGDPLIAEDVLDGEALAEYRRLHPLPPSHQMRFYPGNRCDECQADLGANQGGLCNACALRFDFEQHNEWWEN